MILRQIERDKPYVRFCAGQNRFAVGPIGSLHRGAKRLLLACDALYSSRTPVDLSRRPHNANSQATGPAIPTVDTRSGAECMKWGPALVVAAIADNRRQSLST